jgi:hypothetical protein
MTERDGPEHESERESEKALSNIDLIMVAILLLGGDRSSVDTEDIAVKVNVLV